MSIEFARSYKTSDGKCHGTLEEAQKHELSKMLDVPTNVNSEGLLSIDLAVKIILNNSEAVVNILTMSERSRPKARAVNGGRKPRKNRVTEPVQTTSA